MKILFPLEDAVRKADEDAELKKIVDENNGYLSAIYSTARESLDTWHFSYYCPDKKMAAVFGISMDGVGFEGFSPLIANRTGGRLDMEKVKVGARPAFDIAGGRVPKECSEVLLTLQNPDGVQVWIVNFFTKEMELISVTVDAESGKVLKENKTTLVIGSAK